MIYIWIFYYFVNICKIIYKFFILKRIKNFLYRIFCVFYFIFLIFIVIYIFFEGSVKDDKVFLIKVILFFKIDLRMGFNFFICFWKWVWLVVICIYGFFWFLLVGSRYFIFLLLNWIFFILKYIKYFCLVWKYIEGF